MCPANNSTNPNILGVPGLEHLIDRLTPGLNLEGRIVEVIDSNCVILRVMGNNILTETHTVFHKFDEIVLHVQQVHPKLVFSIKALPRGPREGLYA